MKTTDSRIMGTEKIPSLMIRMAIPSIIAQVINILYNIVDRIYIGHISGVGAAACPYGSRAYLPDHYSDLRFFRLCGLGGSSSGIHLDGKK